MNLREALGGLGAGGAFITLAFLLMVSFYPSIELGTSVVVYGVSFLAGLFLGSRLRLVSSAIAVFMGFLSTVVLYTLWLTVGFKLSASLALAAGAGLALIYFLPTGILDVLLTPMAYFGGFILGNLPFAHTRIGGIEGALQSIVLAGLLGAMVAMGAAIFRFVGEASKEALRRSR
ncbi:hypothetical protein [Palaeococcus ferrophilus]|uniref:hypothetical protein n=1 Tax=Palaeococcus ferrophilus TaxID=83868 RepID=UPI00064F402C|nr:hypothetical protein [Palaeococcus ferrophilus]